MDGDDVTLMTTESMAIVLNENGCCVRHPSVKLKDYDKNGDVYLKESCPDCQSEFLKSQSLLLERRRELDRKLQELGDDSPDDEWHTNYVKMVSPSVGEVQPESYNRSLSPTLLPSVRPAPHDSDALAAQMQHNQHMQDMPTNANEHRKEPMRASVVSPSPPKHGGMMGVSGFRGLGSGATPVDDCTLATSTCLESRHLVSNRIVLDPYGDRGSYSGFLLLSTNLPHGNGKMLYEEDGRTYDGDWRHGRWHGWGQATFPNGDRFEGFYKYDRRHGQGKYEWSDGRIYEGTFTDDKRRGKGHFIWPNGADYVGHFKNGKRDGYGVYKFSGNKGQYKGDWVNGRYEGYGERRWSDGRMYNGEWKAGMAHGKGIEWYPDGKVRHDGNWFEDEPVLTMESRSIVLKDNGCCVRHPSVKLKDYDKNGDVFLKESCPECQSEFMKSQSLLSGKRRELDCKLQELREVLPNYEGHTDYVKIVAPRVGGVQPESYTRSLSPTLPSVRPATRDLDALAVQMQHIQHMQDIVTLQKDRELYELREKLNALQSELTEKRIENALLTERMSQQQLSYERELNLIQRAIALDTERREGGEPSQGKAKEIQEPAVEEEKSEYSGNQHDEGDDKSDDEDEDDTCDDEESDDEFDASSQGSASHGQPTNTDENRKEPPRASLLSPSPSEHDGMMGVWGFGGLGSGAASVDDSTIITSTCLEDRHLVSNRIVLDPFGDRGSYSGVLLLSTNLPHGNGKMLYEEDGRTYDGDWRHGRWHGWGQATFPNGDRFEGFYKYDRRHGQGKYEWSDGRIYEGEFADDKRCGKGHFTWPDGADYVGDFTNGQRDGYGVYKFSANRGLYKGDWVNGRYEGYGECRWSDGRMYNGEWKAGMAHGKGIEWYPDGKVRHDGNWFEDEPVCDE